jgi:hypothetical protein
LGTLIVAGLLVAGGPSPYRQEVLQNKSAVISFADMGGMAEFHPVSSSTQSPSVPVVDLPAEVKVQAGRLVKLNAKSTGKVIRWVLTSEDADLIVSESGTWAIFSAPRNGKYLVLAWTAAGDIPSEAAKCWIIVGEVPPGPGPNPNPDPSDALWVPLKSAWAMESAEDKAKLGKLIALFDQAASTTATVNLQTVKQLNDALKASRVTLIGESLPKIREVINGEFQKTLPTAVNAPLDPSARSLCIAQFSRISALLKRLS